MRIFGKIIGAAFGFMFGGFIGAVFGLIIGHFFDVGLGQASGGFQFGNVNNIRQLFFNTTFAVMGYVAKSDGRVTQQDIQMARAIMGRMRLDEAGRQQAIEQFTQGKQSDFGVSERLQSFHQHCRSPYLRRMFMDLQVQAAFANGSPSQIKRQLLQSIAQQLGFPPIDFAHVESMLYGQYQSYTSGSQYQRPQPQSMVENEAYQILGVTKTASAAEIKRAYRRLMSQNHPDKLVSKGLPEEMIKLATEKTQQIQKAYDLLKNKGGR